MIDYFPDAVQVVLAHEGGFTDDPKDPGGATNFGISTAFLKINNIPSTAQELTQSAAIEIYQHYIWLPCHYGQIVTKPIAIKLFDTGVNIGSGMAIKLAQDVIRQHYKQIAVDGLLGPKTLGVLNTVYFQQFLVYYRDFQAHYYRNIVYHNPKMEPFLKGWLARAQS
jgi:lysozyme family protein